MIGQLGDVHHMPMDHASCQPARPQLQRRINAQLRSQTQDNSLVGSQGVRQFVRGEIALHTHPVVGEKLHAQPVVELAEARIDHAPG